MRLCRVVFCLNFFLVAFGETNAQSALTPSAIAANGEKLSSAVILDAADVGIAMPTPTGVLKKRDASALEELSAHATIVGSTPWIGMKGVGKIVYGEKDPTAFDATFATLGIDRFRLDAQTNNGETSLRIYGLVAKTQMSAGTIQIIPPDTATVGIFPFGLARSASSLAQASISDHGTTTVGGVELHRITVEKPTIGIDPIKKSIRTVVIDFYFDPSSHLLVKSATLGKVANGHGPPLLHIVTYSDYRKVGNSMVPFRYVESLEGQQLWSLQLSEAQLSPSLDNTYFQF